MAFQSCRSHKRITLEMARLLNPFLSKKRPLASLPMKRSEAPTMPPPCTSTSKAAALGRQTVDGGVLCHPTRFASFQNASVALSLSLFEPPTDQPIPAEHGRDPAPPGPPGRLHHSAEQIWSQGLKILQDAPDTSSCERQRFQLRRSVAFDREVSRRGQNKRDL